MNYSAKNGNAQTTFLMPSLYISTRYAKMQVCDEVGILKMLVSSCLKKTASVQTYPSLVDNNKYIMKKIQLLTNMTWPDKLYPLGGAAYDKLDIASV